MIQVTSLLPKQTYWVHLIEGEQIEVTEDVFDYWNRRKTEALDAAVTYIRAVDGSEYLVPTENIYYLSKKKA